MRCEAELAKVEVINWIFTQNKFSNLMRCEAKLAKEKLLVEMLTQNKFSNFMHCEAQMAKREANNWNAYAEQVQQLDALCFLRISQQLAQQNCEIPETLRK